MGNYHQHVHEAVQQAQKAIRGAQLEPTEGASRLQEAKQQLEDAYEAARQYADPKGLQQIQDAQNALQQASLTIQDEGQSPIQAHNAIEQALRACEQIRSVK